jgi:two-component system, NtrC family, sensor histidine kinase PilS
LTISNDWKKTFDFSKTESQSLTIHSIRFIFLLLVLLITLSFQFLENRIEALEVFLPLYKLIGISFVIQITYLFFFRKFYQNVYVTSFLFFFEAFYITGLIYYIGLQQSLLIFLYLVNLILYGILFQRKGSLVLALWTSILFSFIISFDSSLEGNTAYLAVGVNNLAFFTVAYLAGFLSEQLNLMGLQLREKVRDVATLKNLNDLILKNISSGLITVDNKFNLLQANPKALQLLDINNQSLQDFNAVELFPSLDFSKITPEKEFDLEIKKNGEKRIFNISINELFDDLKSKQGLIIRFQDETHLRALEKRLRQSEKLAAIGQLATGIAHEIRNPLAGISGSIQLLQTNDVDFEQSNKLMNIVEKEISRLNNLITEFLDFAKPEAPMEDLVILSNLLEEIINFTKYDKQRSQVELHFEGDKSLKVLGNKDKLKQALLNIIVNAYQAVENVDKPQLKISVRKNGNYALVSVQDNGIGMSEKLKERIFEPFHTTKHKGTGLGLAITHSIFESHGAHVQVESTENIGTEFIVSFQIKD